jgi:hypothetical protein
MITLNKQETYNLIFSKIDKKINITKKLKYRTLFNCNCLCCGKPIYVSYNQISPINIFCEEHKSEGRKQYLTDAEQLIQVHYMRYIKEQQLKIIDNNLNKII